MVMHAVRGDFLPPFVRARGKLRAICRRHADKASIRLIKKLIISHFMIYFYRHKRFMVVKNNYFRQKDTS